MNSSAPDNRNRCETPASRYLAAGVVVWLVLVLIGTAFALTYVGCRVRQPPFDFCGIPVMTCFF